MLRLGAGLCCCMPQPVTSLRVCWCLLVRPSYSSLSDYPCRAARRCRSYWGDALVWGNSHKVDSAGECCAACLAYKPKSKDDTECNGAAALGRVHAACSPVACCAAGACGWAGRRPLLCCGTAATRHLLGRIFRTCSCLSLAHNRFTCTPFSAAVWVYCEDPKLCGAHYRECWLKVRSWHARCVAVSAQIGADAALPAARSAWPLPFHPLSWPLPRPLAVQHLAHPSAVAPAKEGPDVGWTTGLMAEVADSTSSVEAVSSWSVSLH